MNLKIKLKNAVKLIPLFLSLNANAVEDPGAVTVTVEGVEYNVYASESGTFPSYQELLESTPWWGDRDLAQWIAMEYDLASGGWRPNTNSLHSPYAAHQYFPEQGWTFTAAQNSNQIGPFADHNSYIWLLFGVPNNGPSAENTLTSMQPNASAMKNAFNSQYAALAYGLNHDCTVFNTNGVCVSVFGRNTSLNDSSYDNNAAGLILGYKPHEQFRIGTYIDQSLNSNTTGGVNTERSNPDFGLFGVWNMNADGSGLELRAAANYGKRDLNVARSVVGTSEAGSGNSDLNAYGALLEASFSHALNDSWLAKPYAGVRYLSIKRDSYTERMTDDVQNPLSYSGLKQETTSAVVGLRLNGQLASKLVASLNAGFEHDLHHSIDDYHASGVDSLGSIDMNSQKDRTRPTAGLGLAYDIADKQRLSANVQYRKEIFMSESSITGQVTYTIGF